MARRRPATVGSARPTGFAGVEQCTAKQPLRPAPSYRRIASSEVVPHVIGKPPIARGDVVADEGEQRGGMALDQG